MKFIKLFNDISLADISLVGGKNASLGQMITSLSDKGIQVPNGFAITVPAYWHYLESNSLVNRLEALIAHLTDYTDIQLVNEVSKQIRDLIESGTMPEDISMEIAQAYYQLCLRYNQENLAIAVRSSATAEDLPHASFAGQQESFLNVQGIENLLEACKRCFSSLFTSRAIMYRYEKKFDHFKVALSIGIQKMVRSDLASSGVAFSCDTETGFKDAVVMNASYGLGEALVQGMVTPDEIIVHKPTLLKGFTSIIKKKLGSKKIKIIYDAHHNHTTQSVAVDLDQQNSFCLSDEDSLELARYVIIIENFYSELKGHACPMDIEWAKDGIDQQLYIIQARPETIHGLSPQAACLIDYQLKKSSVNTSPVLVGQSIGQHIVSGAVRIITTAADITQVQKGDIIVTNMTDPDWVPAMKKAAGIITQQGGRTCHAAIVSRELNIPALVGVAHALTVLKNEKEITLDCSQGAMGYVYEDKIPFTITKTLLEHIPQAPINIMLNLADPDRAFALSHLPVDGIGLARIEFIITNSIKIHPMALLHPEKITDIKTQQEIAAITYAYEDKKQFFIDSLAQGISMIAAAFYPKPIIVRFSDFKTNEYRNLIGGSYFEPHEENPMIGFRGALRYYSDQYKDGFALECAAVKKAREIMGFSSIKVMIPFVRTVMEAQKVIAQMALNGLVRHEKGLEVIMMCEIPANVILIDEFLEHFDGISIGSNDLTQLTLGVDRDSASLANSFDERNPAMQKMFQLAIAGAQRHKKYSGICGQAPSDYPELADYLISLGIQSISLNPDSVIPFLMRYK